MRIEVDGIEIKFFKVRTWSARYVFAAIGKSFITTVKPLGKIWNRAAQVTQDPFDIRKTLSHAAKDEARRCERCVHEEADERHEPIVEHGFNADRICGMNMNDGAEFIRGFPKRPETSITQRDAIDVAENHYAAKLKLLHGAAQFNN